MSFVDILLYIGIAIMYNVLVHNIASITYQDLQYTEKHQNTIVMLLLFGGFGILISKLIDQKFTQYKNSFLTNGLYYGGILLLITSLFANWETITTEVKFVFIMAIFVVLIWYGYKREQNINNNEFDEEAINELINEKN